MQIVQHELFPDDTGQLSGLDVIKKMREADKKVSIIVLSSQQDEELIPEFGTGSHKRVWISAAKRILAKSAS